MRSREKILSLSADHLQEQADARIREAEQLPDGETRQNALNKAAQLRSYADMKRLLTSVPKSKTRRIRRHHMTERLEFLAASLSFRNLQSFRTILRCPSHQRSQAHDRLIY